MHGWSLKRGNIWYIPINEWWGPMFQQLARPREQGRVLVSFVFNWPFHFYCERVAWRAQMKRHWQVPVCYKGTKFVANKPSCFSSSSIGRGREIYSRHGQSIQENHSKEDHSLCVKVNNDLPSSRCVVRRKRRSPTCNVEQIFRTRA